MVNSELKIAKKMAFNYLYGMNHLILGRSFKYDARTKIGKLANEIVKKEVKKIDIKTILELRKKRRELRYIFIPIFKNPIVNDYILHKYNLNGVYSQNLSFHGGRKHWAKNENDVKILNVLKKHFLFNLK